jgi:hypothetical protein
VLQQPPLQQLQGFPQPLQVLLQLPLLQQQLNHQQAFVPQQPVLPQPQQQFQVRISVANWLKFWPQNTKLAALKYQRQEKSTVEFLAVYPKSGRTFFVCVII